MLLVETKIAYVNLYVWMQSRSPEM